MTLTKLGKILEMKKGKKPLHQLTECAEGYLPYVDIKAFETGNITSYADGEKCLSCEDGDILLVCDGSRSGLVGKAIKGYVGSTLAKISAKGVINDYLFYFLQGKYTALNTRKKGTGTPHVNPDVLMNAELFVPSVAEQQRIVAKIEELFSNLDASVAELKTAKEKLKIYRQAVLKEAFEGNENWEKYVFGDLIEVSRNGYGKKPDDIGYYKILRISAVRAMSVNLHDYRLNQKPFEVSDLIETNDLLFTRYNGSVDYVGVCARVPQITEHYAYPDKIIKCVLKTKSETHAKFLQYYMNSGEARKFIRSQIKTTSGQNGIASSDIKKTIVYLPELKQQEKIVQEIESRLSVCDNIETTIDTVLQQAEVLRQSILKQAFEGKLV